MVRIVEVGPRDGLQNEPLPIPTEAKLTFIGNLAAAGLKEIEATSFVSPKWVPQLADADDLSRSLPEVGALYWALVPNLRGLDRALQAGYRHLALFTAASEAFTLKNVNMTREQSLAACRETIDAFRATGPGRVRVYVSTVVQCPYAGPVEPSTVADVVGRALAMGADEVSLGETLGVAVPREVEAVAEAVEAVADRSRVAWHFHDTRGTAIANVAAMLARGYTTFDSSAAGLGGCPYAPGAGGNLATEDLVYFLERSGIPTGVDLGLLAQASHPILEALGRPSGSRAKGSPPV